MQVHKKLLQSYPTLCDPMDCSPPCSSVHGILQARILEWVAMPSSKVSFQPRDQTCIFWGSCIAGRFLTTEPLGKPPHAEYIMWNAGLDDSQAGIKIAGRNMKNSRYANDIILMVESEEELKSFFTRVKKENEKVGLNLNVQKIKMTSASPIISWQIAGEKSGSSGRL